MEWFAEDKKYMKACEVLDEGSEETFQYAVFGKGLSRIRSTNLLEIKSGIFVKRKSE